MEIISEFSEVSWVTSKKWILKNIKNNLWKKGYVTKSPKFVFEEAQAEWYLQIKYDEIHKNHNIHLFVEKFHNEICKYEFRITSNSKYQNHAEVYYATSSPSVSDANNTNICLHSLDIIPNLLQLELTLFVTITKLESKHQFVDHDLEVIDETTQITSNYSLFNESESALKYEFLKSTAEYCKELEKEKQEQSLKMPSTESTTDIVTSDNKESTEQNIPESSKDDDDKHLFEKVEKPAEVSFDEEASNELIKSIIAAAFEDVDNREKLEKEKQQQKSQMLLASSVEGSFVNLKLTDEKLPGSSNDDTTNKDLLPQTVAEPDLAKIIRRIYLHNMKQIADISAKLMINAATVNN